MSERALVGALSIAGFFVAWEVAARFHLINTLFYSQPTAVVAAAIREVQVPRFWNDVWTSMFEFSVGYVLAVVVGIPMGILIGMNRRLSYLVAPLVDFLYAVPRIALLPLIVLALGLTIWSKVAIVFIGAWVVILLNSYHGVRNTDRRFLDVAHLYGAGRRRTFTSVVLPGSVPFILVGLRLGLGRALVGVVVAELYGATAGLGYMITVASNNLQMDRLLFATILFIIVGLATVEAIRKVEQRAAPWRGDLTLSG
jgi:NitT/TauT family transport system permease protein